MGLIVKRIKLGLSYMIIFMLHYVAMRQKLWGMTKWWKMWCRDVS